MAATYKTREQLEDIFRQVVLLILGLPENDDATVRFPYGGSAEIGSAPFIKRTDNVCFLFVSPESGEYGNPTHITYRDDGADRLTHIDQHTEIYRVGFQCYGPGAFEMICRIISGLTMQDAFEFLLYGHQLAYVSTAERAPTEMMEPKDGEWWTRYDYTARFYHAARIETENYTRRIESVNLTTERSV